MARPHHHQPEEIHVWADFGSGPVIAHLAGPAHVNEAGETKTPVQAPDGTVHDLTYREPADRDAAGSGITFWKL